jgi:hypothetical protein
MYDSAVAPRSHRYAEYGESEYRSRNRAFRRYVLRTILARPDHPLRFLVTTTNRFSRTPRTLFDAGHVIPVATLRSRGTDLERLVVQQRGLNRSTGATPIASVVNVAGVPVDVASLRDWSRFYPQLQGFVQAGRRVRGWNSKTGAVFESPPARGLGRVLELPGTVRVVQFSARRG